MNKMTLISSVILAAGMLPVSALAQYPGFNYQSTNPTGTNHTLSDYQAASHVCQDPWIAQAYLYLGLNINGHSPTQLDPSGQGSTQNQCNYTLYGSWPDFPTLVSNVRHYFSPVAAAPATTPGQATITGPATLIPGQSATVTWSVSQQGRPCQSGVRVLMNGIQTGNPVGLSAGQSTIPATTYPVNTRVTLALVDLCSGSIISNSFAATVGISMIKPNVFTQTTYSLGTPGSKVFALNGKVIRNPISFDSAGNIIASDGTAIVAQGGGNYIDPKSGTLMASNGTPVKVTYGVISNDGGSIVAQGGGNIVAQGGGNIVAQGGGNIVAQGGGNIVAQGGGNSPGYQLSSLPSPSATVATINGPATWPAGQPATVTWSLNQPAAACAAGARVMLNGGIQTGSPVMLSAGRVTIPPTTYPVNSTSTLSLMDLCTGRIVSAPYNTRIVAGTPAPAAAPAPAWNPAPAGNSPAIPAQVTITGPAVWMHAQPNTVTWRVLQQGTACPSGVKVILNNTPTGNPVSLLGGQSMLPPNNWKANTVLQVALVDQCTGRTVSNTVVVTLK